MLACSVASIVSNSLRPHGLWPARLLCPWDRLGKNTGVGGHALLQEVLLTQGSCYVMSPALVGEFFTTNSGKPLILLISPKEPSLDSVDVGLMGRVSLPPVATEQSGERLEVPVIRGGSGEECRGVPSCVWCRHCAREGQ